MKTTRTRIIAAVLAAALVAVVVRVLILWEVPVSRSIVLEITGSAGQQVAVKLEVDGETRTATNSIPVRVQAKAPRLSWEVAAINGPADEKFRVAVHVGEQDSGGGVAEGDRILSGGLVGPEGLRRQRAWHGRFYE